MERIVKTVQCSRGILYALVNTSRYVLAECDAALEITEECGARAVHHAAHHSAPQAEQCD